jgi:hypothetical protein
MRGHTVSVNSSTLKSAYLFGTRIGKALNKSAQCVTVPSNCQSSLNRTIFANNHWKLFWCNAVHKDPNNILKHFKFIYVQLARTSTSALTATDIKKIRGEISLAEDILIKKLSPPCNDVECSNYFSCEEATEHLETKALEVEERVAPHD